MTDWPPIPPCRWIFKCTITEGGVQGEITLGVDAVTSDQAHQKALKLIEGFRIPIRVNYWFEDVVGQPHPADPRKPQS